MTEKEAFEQLKTEVAQLAATVKEHAGDRATIDEDKLAKMVQDLVNQHVAAKLADAERSRPRRKGEKIGPVGFEATSKGIVEGGKFDGKAVDDVLFANWMLRRASFLSDHSGKVRPPSKEMTDVVEKTALTSTGSGTGDEYVPTGMAAQLWGDMFMGSRVVSQFATIPQPADPWDMPLGWGQSTWRKGTQGTATTASTPATAKSTFTSTEQVSEVDWTYDLDEDSIIAVLPTLRADIQRDAAEQMDRFLMNADSTDAATGNINLDDADPDNTNYYLTNGQDGLRHLYLVDNTGQSTDINTTLTDALLRAGIGRLGKYATDVSRLVLFCDPKTYVNALLALTNVVTVDKYGPQATVLTGELMKYQGIPVVPTASIEQAEDDGKLSTTGANNDEGQICIAHRDMWRVAFKRELLIELDKSIQTRSMIMVISFRQSVAARGTRSAVVHTAGIHGIVRA
jgi:HK97 family phage major capsid protein